MKEQRMEHQVTGQLAEWFDKPMRWSQLTLVETDPATIDCDFWLDYFKRTKSDAVCLSAGGYIAYYPTEIPLHYRSAYLGDSDPFGYLVEGCKKMGMVVIARTDPHAVHHDVYEAHPEWIAVDAEGNHRRHWANPDVWVTCALGSYNFDFMTEVHNEILSKYDVDGIFGNRWAGSGMCYCQSCQELFRAEYGMELPRTNDPKDPAYRAYVVWNQKRLFELYDLWNSEAKKIRSNARFIPNSGGGALHHLDMAEIGRRADTLFADRQARRSVAVPWAAGKNGKELRSTLGNKPIGGIFSVGLEEPYRWKDSVQNDEEIRMWVADFIANGLRPWYTKFAATIDDRRWLGVVEDIYNWAYEVEPYLRNTRPVADVAMVFSQQTAAYYGGPKAQQKVEDHILGMYHALIEARIPFEMVHDRLLDAEHVGQFKTLILPNVAALSDCQCDQLREFVRQGGSLVATYETSLYDEWGNKRDNFGLANLFGVDYVEHTPGPMQNSYLRLEKDPVTGEAHPLLAGIENTDRIINGIYRLEVKANTEFSGMPLTLIPSYPDLPMEEVWARQPKTDIPEVYIREYGKGKVVYFPWDIDRIFWEVLCVDHGKLLGNAVAWVTDGAPVVTVTGEGVLDVTVWEQAQSMTVHLVNLTNPMMMKGPIRKFIPVGEQRVRVRLPQGRVVKGVKLLKAKQTLDYTMDGGYLEVVVPRILEHEVVAIDF
ncbi:MAG: hypothetical protein GX030_01680 [Firmicutes bacterium]|nr:hypothetical protein [Bacillota bacterium]